MTVKSFVFVIFAAGLAGFLGGTLGSQKVDAATTRIVAASNFELLNAAGTVVARWETDSKNEAHLRFLRGNGTPSIDVGVRPDGSPIFRILGKDGKERIALRLGNTDKPMLIMSDDRWSGRVHLGFIESDTNDQASDEWGLLFRAFGSERAVAAIGMTKGENGQPEGSVIVEGKRIR